MTPIIVNFYVCYEQKDIIVFLSIRNMCPEKIMKTCSLLDTVLLNYSLISSHKLGLRKKNVITQVTCEPQHINYYYCFKVFILYALILKNIQRRAAYCGRSLIKNRNTGHGAAGL